MGTSPRPLRLPNRHHQQFGHQQNVRPQCRHRVLAHPQHPRSRLRNLPHRIRRHLRRRARRHIRHSPRSFHLRAPYPRRHPLAAPPDVQRHPHAILHARLVSNTTTALPAPDASTAAAAAIPTQTSSASGVRAVPVNGRARHGPHPATALLRDKHQLLPYPSSGRAGRCART